MNSTQVLFIINFIMREELRLRRGWGGNSAIYREHFIYRLYIRLAPVLKTIFHQCVISYTCSQSNSDGSVLKQSHQS